MAGVPEAYIRPVPYTFQLQYSTDNGSNWQPVDLTGIVFSGGGNSAITDAPNGKFTLNHTEMAYFNLIPGMYRVREMDRDIDFAEGYALTVYNGSIPVVVAADGMKYSQQVIYTTDKIALQADDYSSLAFVNVKYELVSLSLSKTVQGSPQFIGNDMLYPFQVLYHSVTDSGDSYIPLPLSTDPSVQFCWISGVPANRLKNDVDGVPSVIWLKHGETVKIARLPSGEYLVRELDDASLASLDYTTGYIIGSGNVTQNGRDATITLLDDTNLRFVNTFRDGTKESTIPSTDDNLLTGGITQCILSALMLVSLIIWYRKKTYHNADI